MQALILVGGEGTRLRPLTSTLPKPVVPLAGRPFIVHMLTWLRGHGVDEVILACGFLPDALRAVLGDGESLDLRLHYVVEPEPLGTGGALKYAESRLADRFLMLNGDVLTDIDLTDQLAQHERTGARATLALTPVDDPSAYGLVRRHADGSVREFVEKPRPEQIDTDLINAGVYILERSVLEVIAAGRPVSIEREVFPALVGRGLFGYAAAGYWLDIGTPARYRQGTFDLLDGTMSSDIGAKLAAAGGTLTAEADVRGTVSGPAMLGSGAVVEAGASVGPQVVLGARTRVGAGSQIERSVVLDDVDVGPDVSVRDSIVASGVRIGAGCRVEGGAVIGADVRLGPGNTLSAGARIFPGVELPEGAIAF